MFHVPFLFHHLCIQHQVTYDLYIPTLCTASFVSAMSQQLVYAISVAITALIQGGGRLGAKMQCMIMFHYIGIYALEDHDSTAEINRQLSVRMTINN